MRRMHLIAIVAFSLSITGSVHAQQTTDDRITDLVKAGKIRVAAGLSIVGFTKHPTTGALGGLAMDLARELGIRVGVEVTPVPYASPPMVLDGLKNGAWDVGFMAIDTSRLDRVDFAPPHLQVDSTYLVPVGAAIDKVIDADRPGARIAVARNSAEEIILRRVIKQAELIVEATAAGGLEALRTGKADVLASSRPTLLQFAAKNTEYRVLQDQYGVVEIAMAVPKGHMARLSYVRDFILEAKSSGFVQRSIERAGMVGFQVPPATAQ